MTGLSFLQKELESKSIPTGCNDLDIALGHGIRLGTITDIVGAAGSGKTQLCLQLTFNTILSAPSGLVDGEVVFISSSRGSFHSHRVNQLADHFVKIYESAATSRVYPISEKLFEAPKFTKNYALSRIRHKLVRTVPELIATVYEVQSFAEKKQNINLIVIDSFASIIRQLDASQRFKVIYEILNVLYQITNICECAVILTNDLTPVITPNFQNSTSSDIMSPALGEAYHHRISQRIVLSREDETKAIIAHVQKNLFGGPAMVKFQITNEGITDI